MRGWASKASVLASAVLVAGFLIFFDFQGSTTPAPSQSSSSTAPPAAIPAGLVLVTVEVPAHLAAPHFGHNQPFDSPRQAWVPAGWTISVWARVRTPRLAAWTPDGALLISQPNSGQVIRLAPAQAGVNQSCSQHSPPVRQCWSVLIDGLDQPHGMAFRGSTLYVAESDQVDAYTYADGKASGRRVIVPGLPDAKSPELKGAYAHALKSVAVGPDGAIYFSIGSTGNISGQDRDATPPRATIMRVPAGGGPAQTFATGVRNGTGLAVAPDGSVWTAVNNSDNVADPQSGPSYGTVIQDYVNDHPPESVARLTPGRELGWPYCNPEGGPANLPFIRDVATNPDGTKLDCAALPVVEQSLGAHSAPLGMSFVDGGLPEPYSRGALIGVHGSWNRTPPRAPEVSFLPWHDGTLGNQQTLVGGFQAPDGSRWGRPVAAVVGPDGAVYVTDDNADAVYRLAPPGR